MKKKVKIKPKDHELKKKRNAIKNPLKNQSCYQSRLIQFFFIPLDSR